MNKSIVLSIISLIFLSTFAFAVTQLGVSDAGADINVDTSQGNINVQGDSVTVNTPQGQVTVNGEDVEVTTESGKTTLKSGNIEVNSQGMKVSIENGKVNVELSNGKNAEIKVMPATASATAIANMKAKCEANICTVELKEVGSGDEAKVQYEVKTQKKAKFLGLFGTDMPISADIDASTGKVIKVHKPWWSFLASEEDVNVSVSA